MIVRNTDQRSRDYSNIASCFRPGHADYTFEEKYGFRDYRGGGRSSARETIGRVAAGAIAEKFLKQLNISVTAYAKSIGPVEVSPERMDLAEIQNNRFCFPDAEAAKAAEDYLDQKIAECDSVGGVVECVISGLPVGLGEPVFEKLDANLAKAILSIGAVKGFEIGDGFAATKACGSENNDEFRMDGDKIVKETNHAGGVLGGISDGSDVVFRAAFKPTPVYRKVPGDRHKGRREYRSRDPRAPRPGGCSESCRCGGIHGRYHRYGHALSVHDIQTRPDPDILSG